jgi:hypothetical protein
MDCHLAGRFHNRMTIGPHLRSTLGEGADVADNRRAQRAKHWRLA